MCISTYRESSINLGFSSLKIWFLLPSSVYVHYVQHKTSFLALFRDNSVLLWISLLNLDNNILWTIRIWLNLLNMVSTDFCIRPQRVIPQCNRRRLNSSLFLISDFLLTMAALVTSISLFLPELPNQHFKPLTKVTSCVLESFTPGPPEPPGSPGT